MEYSKLLRKIDKEEREKEFQDAFNKEGLFVKK